MNKGVYITSDGSIMDFDSLKVWIVYNIKGNSDRKDWGFDDFVGGPDEFTCKKEYLKTKEWFENYKFK